MIANDLTAAIGALWGGECEISDGLFDNMVEAADSPDTLVDAILAAGVHDESLQLGLDTIDEMTELLGADDDVFEWHDEGVALSVQHAPKGGITIGGREFTGGEFIPGDVLAKASPEERAKLDGGSSDTDRSGPNIADLADQVSHGKISRTQVSKRFGRDVYDAVKAHLEGNTGRTPAEMQQQREAKAAQQREAMLAERAKDKAAYVADHGKTDWKATLKRKDKWLSDEVLNATDWHDLALQQHADGIRGDELTESLLASAQRDQEAFDEEQTARQDAEEEAEAEREEEELRHNPKVIDSRIKQRSKMASQALKETWRTIDREDRNGYRADIQMEAAHDFITGKGWTAEYRSKSGSTYYRKGNNKFRLADHEVPATEERSFNQKRGGFSWAGSSSQLTLPVEDDELSAALNEALSEAERDDETTELSGKWQKVGGSSVYVDDGRITKGCPGLKGERVEDLIDESDESREVREARQRHAEAKGVKGHQVTATEAKKLGKVRHVAALRSAKGAAKRYNVSTRQVLQVMPDAFQHLKEQLVHREAAKERARQITGLNAGVLAKIENAHRDYSTVPKFDTAARSVAYEHPELGLDPDSADTAPAVWELIREGREELPDRHGAQVAEVAAQMIAASKSRGKRKPEPQQQSNDEWGDFDEHEDTSFNPDDFGDDGDTSFDPASFEESSPQPSPRRAVIGHVSKQLKTLHKAASELNHFKNIARANGIDPDDVIEALGGVPFSVRMAIPLHSLGSDIADAARVTDRHPTEEQRRAGNYRKGRFRLWGREIVIENARGSVRNGRNAASVEWSVQMPHHYGYIRQTESEADGDHLDVFIGPDIYGESVYVIDQVRQDGQFDEHKIMLGFQSPDDARQGYLDSYSPGWDGFGGLTTMTRAEFLDWIDHGDTSRPLAGG